MKWDLQKRAAFGESRSLFGLSWSLFLKHKQFFGQHYDSAEKIVFVHLNLFMWGVDLGFHNLVG